MTPTIALAALIVLITLPIIILFYVTESPQQRAKRLHARGWTYARIAKRLGKSKTTAWNYCQPA